MKSNIKRTIKNSRLLYNTYRFLKSIPSRIKYFYKSFFFLSNSNLVMTEIDSFFKKEKIDYCFSCGTLLGIIRDNELIKRDMDIDVFVFSDNSAEKETIDKRLQSYGFTKQFDYYIDDDYVIQNTYSYKNVRVDISYVTNVDNISYFYLLYENNKTVKMVLPIVSKTIEHIFNGNSIMIPFNSEECLTAMYGKEWRIPDHNYKYWESPCAIKEDKIGRTIQY